ncbi:DUF6491 family protein [Hyphococcus sp. DH-69]|uniref:DUF6491 family protein n=1 Tax=Hyphococcus formosus TaxID=3143534 RepID=UPI00398AD82E
MKPIPFFLSMLGVGLIASVAHADPSESADGSADPRIGPEVDRICFQRNINGWRTLKKQDDVILLERGVNNWYRVELAGACRYHVLNSAINIGIDSRPGGSCVRRGDVIIVEDSPGFDRRCSITQINEWDDDAVKAENEDKESEDD